MKKMKWFGLLASCLAMGNIATSCTDDLELESTETNSKVKFTLNVSYEKMKSDTRVSLGEDDTTIYWEYGDKLVLINEATNDSIHMYAQIEEGDSSAICSFITHEGVPEGHYYVMCNGNSKNRTYENYRLKLASEINSGKLLKLYSNLDVVSGQTSASIILKNAYAKVHLNILNGGSVVTDGNSAYIGMMSPHGKISIKRQLQTDGTLESTSDSQIFKILDGGMSMKKLYNSEETYYSLMLPQNLEGEDVYFYIVRAYSSDVYEIKKPGINIEAGKSYVINLDLSTATVTKLEKWSEDENYRLVRSAAEWRALRYANQAAALTGDLDFANETVFPLKRTIQGNGYTIRNVVMEAPTIDYMALTDNNHAYNLTVENAIITGRNGVAAITTGIGTGVGSTLNLNCHLKGTCVITGANYVGGICANLNHDVSTSGYITITDCSVEGDITINGNENVGGAIGRINSGIKNITIGEGVTVNGVKNVGGVIGYLVDAGTMGFCSSRANVNGNENVGGIAGYANGGAKGEKCSNTGNITGNVNVGGITGFSYHIKKEYCYNTGTITGSENIGGIDGCSRYSGYRLCYNSGKLNMQQDGINAGGMTGKTIEGGTVLATECYSIGTIEGGSMYMGGLFGYADSNIKIVNCYTSSSNSSDTTNGFIEKFSGNYSVSIKTSLTSLPSFGVSAENSKVTIDDVSQSGVASILDNINVINGNSLYSPSANYLWPLDFYAAYCPVFVWQTNPMSGTIYTPGFGDETNW